MLMFHEIGFCHRDLFIGRARVSSSFDMNLKGSASRQYSSILLVTLNSDSRSATPRFFHLIHDAVPIISWHGEFLLKLSPIHGTTCVVQKYSSYYLSAFVISSVLRSTKTDANEWLLRSPTPRSFQ